MMDISGREKMPGFRKSGGVSRPPYLICALSGVIVILLVVIMTNNGAKHSCDSRLGNLNVREISKAENLSQDGAEMLEKLKDIETMIKLFSKDTTMKDKMVEIESSLKRILSDAVTGTTVMGRLTEIDALVKRILAGEITDPKSILIQNVQGRFWKNHTRSRTRRQISILNKNSRANNNSPVHLWNICPGQGDIQKLVFAVGRMREEIRKEPGDQSPLCSPGWRHYALSCYYMSEESQTWSNAMRDCESMDSHLVVITSGGEQEFVSGITKNIHTWIGLVEKDGTWKWVDGTSYESSPKFWDNDQPDDWTGHGLGGGEDCGQIIHNTKWNDGHCSENCKYMCEKELS